MNLRKAMFVLPNMFTVASIFCGFYAMVSLSADVTPRRLYESALAIFFGIFFDMADGRVARMTRTQSAFGVQLDSLCRRHHLRRGSRRGRLQVGARRSGPARPLHRLHVRLVRCATLGALSMCSRRVAVAAPASFFVGLPIPLAAGVLMSLCMVHQRPDPVFVLGPTAVMGITFLIAYLMISNVRYRTFKDLKFSGLAVAVFVGLLATFAAIAWLVHPTFALLAFVSGYVAYGLLEEVIFFRRRRRERADAKAIAANPPNASKVGHES